MANYIEYIKVGTGESWPVRDKEAQEALSNLVDLVYPVGSIYMSMSNDTSPEVLFGGSWERIQDRFLLAAGGIYTAGSTGGESEHVITEEEMPKHSHKAYFYESWHESDIAGINYTNENGRICGLAEPSSSCVEYAGGGQAHNNMPPYLAVYMWKRTG